MFKKRSSSWVLGGGRFFPPFEYAHYNGGDTDDRLTSKFNLFLCSHGKALEKIFSL